MAAIQRVLFSGKLFSFQINLQMGEINISNKKTLSPNLHKIKKANNGQNQKLSLFLSAPLCLLNQKCMRRREMKPMEMEEAKSH